MNIPQAYKHAVLELNHAEQYLMQARAKYQAALDELHKAIIEEAMASRTADKTDLKDK